MRIISGSLKGRRIHPPAGLPVRPTTDFAKESLFNVLNNLVDFESLRVLDLYAGTGSISYEFVSRGCRSVTAVDVSPKCVSFIYKTALELKMQQLTARKASVTGFLKHTCHQYDLIFADPPYGLPDLKDMPDLILSAGILTPEGIFILEHPRQLEFSTHPNFSQHRNYGNVNFSFFCNAEKESGEVDKIPST